MFTTNTDTNLRLCLCGCSPRIQAQTSGSFFADVHHEYKHQLPVPFLRMFTTNANTVAPTSAGEFWGCSPRTRTSASFLSDITISTVAPRSATSSNVSGHRRPRTDYVNSPRVCPQRGHTTSRAPPTTIRNTSVSIDGEVTAAAARLGECVYDEWRLVCPGWGPENTLGTAGGGREESRTGVFTLWIYQQCVCAVWK